MILDNSNEHQWNFFLSSSEMTPQVPHHIIHNSDNSNVTDNFTQEINQLIIDTNELANLSVDSADLMHLDETA